MCCCQATHTIQVDNTLYISHCGPDGQIDTVNCSTSVSNAQTLYGEDPDAPIRKKTTPVSLLQHAIATCRHTIHYFGTTAIWRTKCYAINACQRVGLPPMLRAALRPSFLRQLATFGNLDCFCGLSEPVPTPSISFSRSKPCSTARPDNNN